MTAEKTKLGITRFFSSYFSGFGKIILTNVIFAVPMIIFFTAFYFLGELINFQNIIISALAVIFCSPFFAGATLVTRNLSQNNQKISVIRTYFLGIKQNWASFLLYGLTFYLAILLSYFSIVFYLNLAQQNAFFYSIVILCIIISAFMLFMFFNIPVMAVTYDLSIKDVFKNSALMSFGELKNNFLAALGVFLLGIFCASFLIFSGSSMVVIILTLIFAAFLVPATASFIINFAVFKGMSSLISSKEERKQNLEKEILYEKNPALKKQEEAQKFRDDFADVVLDETTNDDEYIFRNGKMIKKSVLIQKLKDNGEDYEKKEK